MTRQHPDMRHFKSKFGIVENVPVAVVIVIFVIVLVIGVLTVDRYAKGEPRARRANQGIAVATPMPQFDHPYPGHVVEDYVPLHTARRICSGHDACNWVKAGVCHVVIPWQQEAPVADRRQYRRWEEAGCNGHPDQRITAHP